MASLNVFLSVLLLIAAGGTSAEQRIFDSSKVNT
jgi:hypothetical protein